MREATRVAARPSGGARRFLLVFFGTVLLGLAAAAAAHLALARVGLLPPPPLTATACIDDKFTELRGAPMGNVTWRHPRLPPGRVPLEDLTLVAVGSSATWLNLDMAVFERRFPGTRAYNAAPCWLYIDQTAYYARFLLRHMPRVRTVLTVVAPRDFEACPPEQTAFFDPGLAHAYLSGSMPQWLPYLTGFRPLYLAREALKLRRERGREEPEPVADGHGSIALVSYGEWRPPLKIDPRCYAGLAALEATVAAKGARLVVATLPTMPEWAATYDPGGRGVEDWTRAMAAALRRDTSLLVDGRALAWDDSRFADAVHLIYPHPQPYTEFIADAVAERWPARTAGR